MHEYGTTGTLITRLYFVQNVHLFTNPPPLLPSQTLATVIPSNRAAVEF